MDFTWDDFVERVNNELVANWGNLVNRVLGFAYKRWDGTVPEPAGLDARDEKFLDEVKEGFRTVGALYEQVKLKAAMNEARKLSQRANQYVHDTEPWKTVKTDPQRAATSVYVAIQAIDWLKMLWAPILPHTSQRLHEYLGYNTALFGRQYTQSVEDERGKHLVLRYDHSGATGKWEPGTLMPGQGLLKPEPLFLKLEEGVADQETQLTKNGQ